MTAPGVDDVVMPAQVLSLQKRIEIVSRERDRCAQLLTEATDEAATLERSGDRPGAERALKRAARIRVDVTAARGEVETLESLVAARLSRGRPGA